MSTDVKRESKNRRKGVVISFLMHCLLLLAFMMPFMTQVIRVETPGEIEVIHIPEDYVPIDEPVKQLGMGGGYSGKEAAGAGPEQVAKGSDVPPSEQVKVDPLPAPTPEKEVVSNPTPTPAPEVKPEPAPTPRPDPVPEIKEVPTPAPAPPVVTELPAPIMLPPAPPKVDENPYPVIVDAPGGNSGASSGNDGKGGGATTGKEDGTTSGGSSDHGTGTGNKGEDGTGTGTHGTGPGSGNSGGGHGWIEGDGVIDRKVIYRAEISKFAKKSGIVVVKICINPNGLVVYAEPDYEKSTLKDKTLISRSVETALKWKFERKANAPSKDCGRVTFRFTIPKEMEQQDDEEVKPDEKKADEKNPESPKPGFFEDLFKFNW